MKPTLTKFKKINDRKNKLSVEWHKYLIHLHSEFNKTKNDNETFDKVYEGLATITYCSRNYIGLHLDNGKTARYVHVSPEISSLSRGFDCLYILMGLKNKKWWPLNISLMGDLNPELIDI